MDISLIIGAIVGAASAAVTYYLFHRWETFREHTREESRRRDVLHRLVVEALDNAAWNAYIESIIDGWLKAHEASILTPREVQDALYRWIAEPYSLRAHRDALQQYTALPIRDEKEQELYVAITGVYNELTLNTVTLRMLRLFQELEGTDTPCITPEHLLLLLQRVAQDFKANGERFYALAVRLAERYPFLAETHARKMRLLLEQLENYQKQSEANTGGA
ncbi:MAG: hypothetical protein RMM08_13715 [Armatimonadota bacterium]|nr:hypothetical protein [bacterium]MDW8322411.1 hypothetical protein [Armatimonadota bacterium]